MSDGQNTKEHGNANRMWGGVFARGPGEAMRAINVSIHVDKRLYREDIAGSLAHAAMLAEQGIVTLHEVDAIIKGLKQIEQEIEAGNFTFTDALEDIHMHVEARLKEIIGETAGRLHTARSRNDQAVTGFRLFLRGACDETIHALRAYRHALLDRAAEHATSIMPGFTHLQVAQPVTLGHHLLAYAEMAARDTARFTDARSRLNESPLGACALAGTSFPIDRHHTSELLGFDRPMANSMDAVASRDFALEYLAAVTIAGTHLSRFAEELILWTCPAFGFATLSDAFSTGSSIMPQKRNPDAAELVRGKTGRMAGSFAALTQILKGLPLAYNKDLQEDKSLTFEAHDTLMLCLTAMTGMVRDASFHTDAMRTMAGSGHATATDLADWLVQRLGMPFRDAHHATGTIVKRATALGVTLAALPLAEMQNIEPRITEEARHALSVEHSVHSKHSLGGTAPERVREAVENARTRLSAEEMRP